jgi:hypothetical protein
MGEEDRSEAIDPSTMELIGEYQKGNRESLEALFHEQSGFLQLTAPDLGQWPVDLMVVDGSTFSRLQAEAESIQLGGETAPVASVTHLILMKLHAMKTGPIERRAKDLADLIELLRLRDLDPRSAEFRAMCEKYADREIHERTIEFWGEG